MDKPEKIKIGCCPFCGGNIKRANMKAFSRQSQIYGFNLALDGVADFQGTRKAADNDANL